MGGRGEGEAGGVDGVAAARPAMHTHPMDDDIDLGPVDDVGPINLNLIARPLLDVAKVALGDGMEHLSVEEALPLLEALLTVVEHRMPEDLQAQDRRVLDAREWVHVLQQLNGERSGVDASSAGV